MVTNSKAPPPAREFTARPPDDSGRQVLARIPAPNWRQHLAFRNIGVVYVLIAIIVMFSIWKPDLFPTWVTVRSILNQNAIAGLVALALVVPLSARVFDLSVGSAVGLCNVFVAWLLVNKGVSMVPAIVLTIVAGLFIGALNAGIVVGIGIDSFIATLATGSLLAAATTILDNNQVIIGDQLTGTFGKLATIGIGGIALPVFLMLGVAVGLWYLQKYTVTGRRIYATGFNAGAARLGGIRTARLRAGSLIVSGLVAGVAGVLLTSQVSSGSPEIGPPYLLNAFAAAFLGATQFGGRFNAWGTVLAVLLLGTGSTGLTLVGAPSWTSNMFSGVVLIAALALTKLERKVDVRALTEAQRRAEEQQEDREREEASSGGSG
jgi:ribose transport system permease protein